MKYRNLRPTVALAFIFFAGSPPPDLLQLAPAPGFGIDSVVYVLSPQSILEVHAGKSGLLAGFGHEHRVRAHVFSGTVVYFPNDASRSRVSVTVRTDSLRVVLEADSADIPEIERSMREKTLRVDSFPEIRFVSRTVGLVPAAGAAERVAGVVIRVSGDLTMVGKTRLVTLDLSFTATPDTLRALGEFRVRQTDFGIKPFSKALGMVKVKDEVRFELRLVATAQSPGR